MKYLLFLLVSIGIIGCGNTEHLPEVSKITDTTSRFDLHLEQEVYDDLAYGDKRGIYVLTDKTTGKQYIGVSGIGISELGSHQAGKTTVGDER